MKAIAKTVSVLLLFSLLSGFTQTGDLSGRLYDTGTIAESPAQGEASETCYVVDASGTVTEESPLSVADSPLVNAVNTTIEQYKNGAVDTETRAPGASKPAFQAKPSDFEFPEIKSEADFEATGETSGSAIMSVYVKGTGAVPYMIIHIDTSRGYAVVSVIFKATMF